jgi:adenine-specific DNA-methyltransferase
MATKGKKSKPHKRPIEQYDHKGKKRVNNPPVGLVTPQTDPILPTHRTYQYDPHLDPQLVWAGKAEHTSFEVPTVSLHVHERIDPRTIIEAVRKRNGSGRPVQGYLFESKEENPPLRDAIDFYKHAHNWSNRLIAGDSLLVMNSLLGKEGMGGQIQMVYMDPPYGIKYGSNFQPFVNRRDVKDGKDEDLTQEPEMVRAFRDTWELGLHSYLTYLRDRLMLARELLRESGSCFLQIGDENLHHVRELMDEVFGKKNFIAVITVKKTAGLGTDWMPLVADYLVWYSNDREKCKYRPLYSEKELEGDAAYTMVEDSVGNRRRLTPSERADHSLLPHGARVFRHQILLAAGRTESCIYPIKFEGEVFQPTAGRSWATNKDGMQQLIQAKRVAKSGSSLSYVRYAEDFRVNPLSNVWDDTASGSGMEKS